MSDYGNELASVVVAMVCLAATAWFIVEYAKTTNQGLVIAGVGLAVTGLAVWFERRNRDWLWDLLLWWRRW